MTQASNAHADGQAELGRLESDLRVLSSVGIERAAWGWDHHEADDLQSYHAAERAAIRELEEAGQAESWNALRRRLFFEVEGRYGLVAWKAEQQRHTPHVHKAERAALGAALALTARARISHEQYATLVSAMAEALPWLLPERRPTPAL